MVERETMEFDVVIVGAGPSGLASAIKLAQLAQEQQQELMICVVEKGSEVGAHVLSGAVFETRALDELLPNWQELGAPLHTQVTEDEILWFSDEQKAKSLPHFMVPKTFHNNGNYIVSMGNVCRFLAEQAEQLGVEIFPGFSAHELLIEDDSVKGIITGDMGRDKEGNEKPGFMPGMELRAKYTIFAEGCRGHLGKQLINQFALDKDRSVQHYGLGFKEIWQVDAQQHQQGKVVHGTGWPLSGDTNGGAFMYHCEDNQVVVGLIVDLNYTNPHLSPFDEFQRMKHHPVFADVLKGGKRLAYGARAIAKGGLHSLPKMHFPGGLLVGCDAGTLNFAKIKGNHTAMKSGMLAAESIFEAIKVGDQHTDLADYAQRFESSWVYDELYRSRNFGPAMHKLGKFFGGAYNTLDQNLFAGKLPFTFKDNTPDYATLLSSSQAPKIDYPKPDGELSFDKLSSVFLSNTNHEESQPCHLQLKDAAIPITVNLPRFDEPAQRYCPAGVYEVDDSEGEAKFVINAQNCVHCKTCDIKDPSQNITWVTPEGAGGPNYPNM
ncbi:electron transfer flavoprotein-ubiquinone oxidoreductase [Pseudoalteromonas sp. Cnat2-41]|uniref:electron transfer flavoprotein-ubiquinone oxidoreductase n=1 Tax=unclassified Pseudoalteromonas TaxID=194690 RepID=UPI001EF90754|nr:MULTISPECIES: electron transfer flavoprotein-ubiquinone oxidoreductase [unclassified Pseudoalteromonas]MCF2861531.1 electron transfer flavoprotein-ubiquinone oxidoreductase [Pseudoalteromonas sp. CNAT2-18]MCG7557431.1 electron transfer flavoprotein-ubiquinone oxidoreductase [Pseudoalteromonas sp. CNAT2-18.1]